MRKNDIKALSDIEHVRVRPSMYVGSVDMEKFERWIFDDSEEQIIRREVEFVPGVLKLFDEIISNSIDESIRTEHKFANKIHINIDRDSISVLDNGRGIPSKKAEGASESMAELALTHLRAGANFHNENFVSIGTHGLGASLVNILSKKFEAWTDDGEKRISFDCRDGMSKKNISVWKSKGKNKTGTYIKFTPDWSLFGCNEISGDLAKMIRKRVFDLAVCYPEIKFYLDGKMVQTKHFSRYASMFSDDAICLETDNFKAAVFPSEDPGHISFVNGIDTYEGGTHLDYVRNKVVDVVLEQLNKKYKKLKLKPSDVRNKITVIVISNKIKNPKFRSQTKEYISNPLPSLHDVFGEINDSRKATIFFNNILKTDAILDPIIETKKLRLAAAERVAVKKASKKLNRIKVPKHIPANGDPSKTSLFITEGDSATVPFSNARDSDLHGCYPLRGKPMNTWGQKPTKIINNKEIQQLMAILGLRFDSDENEELGYRNIRIMADADFDGYAITSLMIAFFSRWPWLFKQKRIGIVRCPIMILSKGKDSIRVYSIREYDELVHSGKVDKTWNLKYFKGLGSLTTKEYEKMLNDPEEDLVLIDENCMEKLEMAFGNNADARKEWLA